MSGKFDALCKITQATYVQSVVYFPPIACYIAIITSIIDYCVSCRLSDAADIVRLFHIVYPNSKSAVACRNKKITDEKKLIQVSYIAILTCVS